MTSETGKIAYIILMKNLIFHLVQHTSPRFAESSDGQQRSNCTFLTAPVYLCYFTTRVRASCLGWFISVDVPRLYADNTSLSVRSNALCVMRSLPESPRVYGPLRSTRPHNHLGEAWGGVAIPKHLFAAMAKCFEPALLEARRTRLTRIHAEKIRRRNAFSFV